MNIEGRIAVVTGGAAGIGRATAVMLAKKGAKGILIADLDETGAAQTCNLIEQAGTQAIATPTDVTDIDALEAMYASAHKTFGTIDIVFNNAGIVSGPPPFPMTNPGRVKQVIDIDLTSVILSTQIAIRHMKETGGVIVNTASTGGLTPYLEDAPYAAAKAGVIMFSRSCGPLKEQMNIRVNAVCPGITQTPILEKLGGGSVPDWVSDLTDRVKLLSPEDIANAVVQIVEDDNMAGEYLVVANEPQKG